MQLLLLCKEISNQRQILQKKYERILCLLAKPCVRKYQNKNLLLMIAWWQLAVTHVCHLIVWLSNICLGDVGQFCNKRLQRRCMCTHLGISTTRHICLEKLTCGTKYKRSSCSSFVLSKFNNKNIYYLDISCLFRKNRQFRKGKGTKTKLLYQQDVLYYTST